MPDKPDAPGSPGSLIRSGVYATHKLTTLHGNKVRGENWFEFDFKAPKGQRFVFLFVGAEPADGSKDLDVDDLLKEMGWTPPKNAVRG